MTTMSTTSTSISSLATPPPTLSALPPLNLMSEKHIQGARIPRFGIKPSSLLKSPIMKWTKKFQSGFHHDNKIHLAAEEFRVRRLRSLHRSSRCRAAAEEDQCQKQQQELKILMFAAEKGLEWTSLDPQLALALARAARDTLLAEEETAKLRINECENLLATLKDAADDAHARVEDANHQIGSIMTIFDREGFQIDLRNQHFEPSSLHIPNDPPPASSDIESLLESDCESASDDQVDEDDDQVDKQPDF